MKFGKHEGKSIHEIDSSYLRWLIGLPDLDFNLRRAIEAELETRAQHRSPEQPAAAPRHQLAHPGVVAWRESWREIVMRCHPDRGGDAELFKIMNRVNEKMSTKEAS